MLQDNHHNSLSRFNWRTDLIPTNHQCHSFKQQDLFEVSADGTKKKVGTAQVCELCGRMYIHNPKDSSDLQEITEMFSLDTEYRKDKIDELVKVHDKYGDEGIYVL